MAYLALLDRMPAGQNAQSHVPPVHDGANLPGDWETKSKRYEPEAFPTPYGIAEATRLALCQYGDASDHELLKRWRQLIEGLAAGELRLEPFWLGDGKLDNLGRALRLVEPSCEYLCWIKDREGKPFGLTHPDCLVWRHARRTEAEWDELAKRVEPTRARWLPLLADMRAALHRSGRWRPTKAVPWQIGLEFMVEGVAISHESSLLRDHSSGAGPIHAFIPSLDVGAGEPEQTFFYFPQLAEDSLKSFSDLLAYDIKPSETAPSWARQKGPGLDFVDAKGTVLGRVAMPSVQASVNAVALGMGGVELAPSSTTRAPAQGGAHDVDKLSAALKSIEPLLRYPSDDASVLSSHVLHPDALRFTALIRRRIRGEGEGWPECLFTARVQIERVRGRPMPDPHGALGAWAELSATTRVGLVDQMGEVYIGDLRSLGLMLFRVFTGEAIAREDLKGNVATNPEAPPPLFDSPKAMLAATKHPFEMAEWVWDAVSASPPPELLDKERNEPRRLALLQRLVASYGSPQATGIDGLLAKAARSFARWASGGREVAPIGRPGERTAAVKVSGGLELRLARDGKL